MKKLKKEFRVTGAVIASLAAVVLLSSVGRNSVSAQSVELRSADEIAFLATGVGDAVFADTEEGIVLNLKTETAEVDNSASFDPVSYIEEVSDQGKALPVLRITSDVNTEENGEYSVQYEALNLMGETVQANLSVTVRYSEAQLKEIEERKAAEEAARREEEARAQVSSGNVSLSTLGVYDTGTVYGMVEAINAVRAAYGLYPFAYASSAAFDAAAIRAQECTYYLSHTRPDGRPYYTALDECGVSYGYAAEILVAYGSSIQDNLNWWLSEPGHAAIVLSSSDTYIAVGYAGGIWSAEVY